MIKALKFFIKCASFAAFSSILATSIYSKNVAPIPSGEWWFTGEFSEATGHNGDYSDDTVLFTDFKPLLDFIDSAGTEHWSYPLQWLDPDDNEHLSYPPLILAKNESDAVNKAARFFIPEEIPIADVESDDSTALNMPYDFPGYNTEVANDFFDKEHLMNAEWFVYEAGDWSADLFVFPRYICPPGTRQNPWDGNCTDTPYVANADVVGRDLNAPLLGFLGHLGLTTYLNNLEDRDPGIKGNFVLQVMREPPIVQIVTLENFEDVVPGKYWGEVYGPPGNLDPRDEAENAQTAIKIGWEQRKYHPEYVFTTDWQQGGLQQVTKIEDRSGKIISQEALTDAKFRCDTFVIFIYLYAYHVDLSPFILPTSPSGIFHSFQNKRTDVVPELTHSTLPITPKLNAAQQNILGIAPELSSQEILKLDQSIQAVLTDKTLSSQAKNASLWSMAKQNHNDPAKFQYLIDTLSLGQRACDLTSQYVESYDSQISTANKRNLISAVADSCLKIGKSDTALSNSEKNPIFEAQSFIKKRLETETDPLLLEETIAGASEILPANPHNYTLVAEAIDRLKSTGSIAQQDLQFLDLVQLTFIMANPDLQKEELPTLLVKPKGALEKDFDRSLIFLLKKFDPSSITDSSKGLLLNYLNQEKLKYPELGSLEKAEGINTWYAEAALMSASIKARNELLIEQALKAPHENQAILIDQLDRDVFDNASLEALKTLASDLQPEKFKTTSSFNREAQVRAISKLNSLIRQRTE